MTPDPQTLEAATAAVEAVIDSHALGDTPDPERLARAALEAVPEAILEEAPLNAVHLERLDNDYAHFGAPGGMSLVLHRGDWVERGRPSRLDVSILDFRAMRP